MPNDYTLSDLVKLTGITPRTVRYYIAQGLLPSPSAQGPNARYSDVHLDRLRLIRKLQAAHLPLAEIRKQLGGLPPDEIAALAESAAEPLAPTNSALEYINSVLRPAAPPPGPVAFARPATAQIPPPAQTPAPVQIPAPAALPVPAAAAPAAPAARTEPAKPRTTEPERAQWERIVLDPDVELHIRRPLTRHQNKNVERLISIARQLLEE
jgi:DNA-binding transcriptional MerR regulator